MAVKPEVAGFFDEATKTVSYVLADPESKHCAVIDAVWDYDYRAGRTSTTSVEKIESYIREHEYIVDAILETHAHADHLSAAQRLKDHFDAPLMIGDRISDVQRIFKAVFNLEEDFATDGSQFDRLLGDGEIIVVGGLEVCAMHTPGHTPACMTYVCDDVAFVGDTLFMPDYGTARTDFPGGDAATLFQSIQKIFALPGDTKLYMCHDYLPNSGRSDYCWQTTVAVQRAQNVHVREAVGEAEFVAVREGRDENMNVPDLLLPSVQVNIRAGELPPPDCNGVSYLKIPVNKL